MGSEGLHVRRIEANGANAGGDREEAKGARIGARRQRDGERDAAAGVRERVTWREQRRRDRRWSEEANERRGRDLGARGGGASDDDARHGGQEDGEEPAKHVATVSAGSEAWPVSISGLLMQQIQTAERYATTCQSPAWADASAKAVIELVQRCQPVCRYR